MRVYGEDVDKAPARIIFYAGQPFVLVEFQAGFKVVQVPGKIVLKVFFVGEGIAALGGEFSLFDKFLLIETCQLVLGFDIGLIAGRRVVFLIVKIFELFAQGWSPRAIAKYLNDAGIPSPRGGKWLQSAIYGDHEVGYGILNNPLYDGKYIWNRRECRKNPDTGKRTHVRRPESERITPDMPELRRGPEALWAKVTARQQRLRSDLGGKIRDGITKAGQTKAQKGFRYLLSGLLKCGKCGGNYVVCSSTSYGCTSNLNGGDSACSNGHRLPRKRTEQHFLGMLRDELLTPDAIAVFTEEVEAALKTRGRASHEEVKRAKQVAAKTQTEIDNIMAANMQGIITDTTRKALESAEERKAKAEESLANAQAVDEASVGSMVAAIPRAVEKYRKALDNIETTLSTRMEHSRELLRDLLGDIKLTPRDHALEASLRLDWRSTLNQCEAPEISKLKVMMVGRRDSN